MERYAGIPRDKIAAFLAPAGTEVAVFVNLEERRFATEVVFGFEVGGQEFTGFISPIEQERPAVYAEIEFKRRNARMGRHDIVGDMGHAAIQVFSAVVTAVVEGLELLKGTKFYPDFIFFTSNENKRSRLYEKFARFFPKYSPEWEHTTSSDEIEPVSDLTSYRSFVFKRVK